MGKEQWQLKCPSLNKSRYTLCVTHNTLCYHAVNLYQRCDNVIRNVCNIPPLTKPGGVPLRNVGIKLTESPELMCQFSVYENYPRSPFINIFPFVYFTGSCLHHTDMPQSEGFF